MAKILIFTYYYLSGFSKEHAAFSQDKVNAFQCDLTSDNLLSHVPECSVDIATLVFVLSAIHPDKMLAVLQNIIQVCVYFCLVNSFFLTDRFSAVLSSVIPVWIAHGGRVA